MKEVEYQKYVQLKKIQYRKISLNLEKKVWLTHLYWIQHIAYAYEIISSNWEKTKNKCLEYTCTICSKQEWKSNLLKLGPSSYKKESKMFEKCYKGEHYSLERVIEFEIFKNRFEGKEEYVC